MAVSADLFQAEQTTHTEVFFLVLCAAHLIQPLLVQGPKRFAVYGLKLLPVKQHSSDYRAWSHWVGASHCHTLIIVKQELETKDKQGKSCFLMGGEM